MKRSLAALLVLTLLLPVQAAEPAPAAAVRFGGPLPLDDAATESLCGEATIAAGEQIVFEATGALAPPTQTGSRTCAQATVDLQLPATTTSLRLDVDVQLAGTVPGRMASWRLEVQDEAGGPLASLDSAASQSSLDVPARGPVQLIWSFDIPLLLPSQQVQVTIVGVTFAAEADLPAASVVEREYRAGTLRIEEASVAVDLDEATAGLAQALMLSVPDHFRFEALVLPDGTRVEAATTAEASPDAVRLERAGGLLTVHVPGQVVAGAGPGSYELVARATYELQPNAALTPLAIALLALPLTLAVLAERGARAFEREAFGHFAVAARRLRLGALLLAAFYAVVFVAALVGGRAALMTVWPLNLEGWLLYGQALAAVAAFLGLYVAARRLRMIVTPPPVK